MPKYPLWEFLTPEDQEKLRALAPPGWRPPVSKPPRYKLKQEDIEQIARLIREPSQVERGKDW